MTKKFEVGYAKPPKGNQFRKGQSGNPTGRPKKSKDDLNIQESMRKILRQKKHIVEGSNSTELSILEILLHRSISLAANSSRVSDVKAVMDMIRDFGVIAFDEPEMSNEEYHKMNEFFEELRQQPLPKPPGRQFPPSNSMDDK